MSEPTPEEVTPEVTAEPVAPEPEPVAPEPAPEPVEAAPEVESEVVHEPPTVEVRDTDEGWTVQSSHGFVLPEYVAVDAPVPDRVEFGEADTF